MAAKRNSPKAKVEAKAKAKPKAKPRGKLAPARERRGLAATEVALPLDQPEIAALAAEIVAAGGAPLGAYRDPLGGRPLLLASLPLAALQPTPFQRDLSPAHTKRLATKIDEAGAFLDPLIVVRGADGGFGRRMAAIVWRRLRYSGCGRSPHSFRPTKRWRIASSR